MNNLSMESAIDMDKLLSSNASRMSRRIYSDEAVYRLEQDRIFKHNWLYLAHESQLKNSGDFMLAYMGEVPVIVARGEDGKIHASVNSCSHRGVPVCSADKGNARSFVCPYHGWTYASDGRLLLVPQDRKKNCINKESLGLKQVPRIESVFGLIFGCFDPEVESLESHLGDMRYYLEAMFDRFPSGIEVVGAAQKWRLSSNWKLPVETLLGDVAHGQFLHGSFLSAKDMKNAEDTGLNVVPKAGHGSIMRLLPPDTPIEHMTWGMEAVLSDSVPEELKEYLLNTQRESMKRLDAVQGRIKASTLGVYPNFSAFGYHSSIRVSHPRGPGETEYWTWWFVPADASDAVREMLRPNYNFYFGPGGALEQEDVYSWQQQFIGASIPGMEDTPLVCELGLGEETSHPEMPGQVGDCYNEHYVRQFYLRWKEDMKKGGE
ncbi:phenylpropionate dioxygenase alpha subunit [Oryzisolibacter propanilivorax]|uniref:Phenylpropionate dioxygenase alpha subunit n=1 Tax=Oryzisolibacter propanilivorax TaxID=1527607 RepID=A0A1G9RP66_9BURK|nr:aromatic ring-hydroxylating dioxygenase subunit alpha [Oryzisolibacter propanilivorax]SDM24747.1 phenylpropionate dioxygenase alpha subunit [Oryzisolibacter propanilivorax]